MTLGRRSRRSGESGSSAVEVLVATGIATLIAFAIGTALRDSSIAVAEMTAGVVTDGTARAALVRVFDELKFADREQLNPLNPVEANSLQYRQVIGWNDSGEVWSNWHSIGTNKDGDLVADGVVICTGVKTFEITREQDTLLIVLTVEREVRGGRDNSRIERTLRGRVVLSN